MFKNIIIYHLCYCISSFLGDNLQRLFGGTCCISSFYEFHSKVVVKLLVCHVNIWLNIPHSDTEQNKLIWLIVSNEIQL